MQAAMRLALRGGFAAMTVRQIAREAQVAAGQLHPCIQLLTLFIYSFPGK